jgi:hypothetical protein
MTDPTTPSTDAPEQDIYGPNHDDDSPSWEWVAGYIAGSEAALARAAREVSALIEERGGLCVDPGDNNPICETHSELLFDGFCEDDPRDLRAVLRILRPQEPS